MDGVMFDVVVREVRHAAIAAGLFVAMVAPGAVDAQGGGSITGTVTSKATGLRPLRVTIDQKVCGAEVADESIVVNGSGGVANAVISVAGLKAAAASASGVMNEKCRFSPRVQIVRPNAMITTSSADPILHTTNAQIDGGKVLFNVAVPVPGLKINKPVAGTGLVRLTCNTHPWMRGFVVVTDDMAAISDGDGGFVLKDVPAGTYELRVWHEALKGASQRVTVVAGKPTTMNFALQ
jgi:Carboxypeptidase regulatory-like domain